MYFNSPDVYSMGKNRKGVQFLYSVLTEKVVAKKCTNCNKWYFLHQFNKAGKGFAGTHSLCRTCHAERNAEHRTINKLISDTFVINMGTRRDWF